MKTIIASIVISLALLSNASASTVYSDPSKRFVSFPSWALFAFKSDGNSEGL